ncbi:MAG: hypothetical protein L7U48_02000 [Candidatus Poseidoniaceae archaeon]|nr:hypothetical protein [Candidatus Poseidoniaceae archaeon]
MNRLLALMFCSLMLFAPMAGCLEEPTPEDTTPPEEDTDPSPPVNGTDPNTGGSGSGGGGSGGDTNTPGPSVNETDDSAGGSDSGGDSGGSDGGTDSSNQNETDEDSGTGGSDPGDSSGSGGTDPSNGGDVTVGNTTECDTGESGFAFSIVQFDITNHPNFVNIGGLEIECGSNILYGFAWDQVTEVEHFISIDPSNGLVTSLAEITGIDMVTSHSTFGNDEYFAVMRGSGTVYMVQISTSTGYSIALTEFDYSNHPELANAGGIEYDAANDLLYAYAFDDSNSGGGQSAQPGQPAQTDPPLAYVVTVDPSNGMVTKHSEILDVEGIADGASAFDGDHYYLNVRKTDGSYEMATIDVSDFSMSMSSVLSSTNQGLTSPNGFEVNVVTGIIYGYAWDSVNEEEVFISYDIDAESITQIGVITGITLVTSTSTQEGVDFYAIMADSSRQNFLVHIQY